MRNASPSMGADGKKIRHEARDVLANDAADITFAQRELEAWRRVAKIGRQLLDGAIQSLR